MTSLEPIIAEHPFFEGLSKEDLALVVGCASNVVFKDGEKIIKEGQEANSFFLIRHGQVAIEVFNPGKGAIILQTLHEGEPLGWSWLIPPYKWHFDGRAHGDG